MHKTHSEQGERSSVSGMIGVEGAAEQAKGMELRLNFQSMLILQISVRTQTYHFITFAEMSSSSCLRNAFVLRFTLLVRSTLAFWVPYLNAENVSHTRISKWFDESA